MLLAVLGQPHSSGTENTSCPGCEGWDFVYVGGGVLWGEVSPVSPSAAPWDLQLLLLQPQPCLQLLDALLTAVTLGQGKIHALPNAHTATGEACAS